MTAQDFFFYSLGVGCLMLSGSLVLVIWQIYKMLSDIRTITRDVASVRQAVGVLAKRFMSKVKKGGDEENSNDE
jgi:hypothetical protein